MMHSESKYFCLVCKNELHFWCNKQGRRILKCKVCGHINVPDGVVILESGKSIYETEHSIFEKDGNLDYYLDDANMLSAGMKASLVEKYVPKLNQLLDVGANYGHFLKAVQSIYNARGFEISPEAVAWSIQNFGVDNQVGSVYEMPENLSGPFDVVTCWDVIEHLDDPGKALEKIRERIKSEGLLFLSTPDAGSFIARIMGRTWHYLDPVQHINVFSKQNLIKLLEDKNFKIIKTYYTGHCYKIDYIINRLIYLNEKNILSSGLKILKLLPEKIRDMKITIKLFDVVVIIARKV